MLRNMAHTIRRAFLHPHRDIMAYIRGLITSIPVLTPAVEIPKANVVCFIGKYAMIARKVPEHTRLLPTAKRKLYEPKRGNTPGMKELMRTEAEQMNTPKMTAGRKPMRPTMGVAMIQNIQVQP